MIIRFVNKNKNQKLKKLKHKVSFSLLDESNIHMTHIDFTNFMKIA